MKHAPFGAGAYTAAFIAVLALATTSLLFSLHDIGRAAIPVALGIAVLKAAVIAGVFIGLVRLRPSMILAVALALALFGAMLGFMAMDVATR